MTRIDANGARFASTIRPTPAAEIPLSPRVMMPEASEDASNMQSMNGFEPLSASATILIAEDHHDSRDALRTLLEAVGYRAVVATNGREAVDLALVEVPDLILMDVMMPEMDGLEATRVLRQHAATRLTPIIAVTAMEGAWSRTLEAGASDFVRKPVDASILLAKVESWLSRAAS